MSDRPRPALVPEPLAGADPDPARAILGAQPDRRPRGLVLRVIRRLFREALWVFVVIMNAGRRFGSILLRTEYRLAGGCDRRGACCHHVLLEWSPLFDRHPWLGRVVLWKLTRIYSFFDRGYSWEVQDGLVTRVLGCHALRTDGSCGEYRLRPLICRAYPELPLMGKPLLLKGCGFRFERRDGEPEPTSPADEGLVQIRRPASAGPGPLPDPVRLPPDP